MIHDVTCWVMEVVILAGDLIPVPSATSAPGGRGAGVFCLDGYAGCEVLQLGALSRELMLVFLHLEC
jgi:hypothetical protein